MAKDGTLRGGARPGTGPKRRDLETKILKGMANKAEVIKAPNVEIIGLDMPDAKQYLTEEQRDGEKLEAEQIYKELYEWLAKMGCEKIINPMLIQQYSMAYARQIQCEKAISRFGLLAKHPTTGNAIQSPYVAMSTQYIKQMNTTMYMINQIVRENCASGYTPFVHNDSEMARLLDSE